MIQNLKKRQEGFTIIEVMIVLVIAAVILLIVFLAVPALQRNARNTQRKNDVSSMLAAVNEFTNNNSGKSPTGCSGGNSGPLTVTGASGTTSSQGKVGYYNKADCSASTPSAGGTQVLAAYAATGPLNTAAADYVVIVPAATCDTTTVGKTAAGSARQYAAVYEIENGSGTFAPVCQES